MVRNKVGKRVAWGILGIVLAVVLPACASTGSGERRRVDPEYISREEIMEVEARNLYEVVQRLRPRWLTAERRAGDRSFELETGVVVYQGQMLLGGIDVLREWSPSAAYGLTWLDGSEASATLPGLGSRHVAGAIVIRTRPAGG